MKRILRIIGLIAIIVLIFAAIIVTTKKPSNSDMIWDERTTIGNIDAKNYFIIYSDLVCPYCVAFENAIVENEEEFKQYIADNDILVEVRLSDFLYEFSGSNPINSRYSAVGAYCARNQDKFWDYYNLAIKQVWDDYFAVSGKSAFSKLNSNSKDYWIDLGKQVGLGEEFENCVENDEPLEEIVENAGKIRKLGVGMPYFKFNRYSPPGFPLTGTWEDIKSYFEEGLSS